MPGMTVLPARLTRVAPAGTRTSAARPTAVKRLPVTMNVAFSIGARPSPTMTRAPSKAMTPAGACASIDADHAAMTATAARTRSFTRFMEPSSEGDSITSGQWAVGSDEVARAAPGGEHVVRHLETKELGP